jgi:NADH-quinone oxidoreductase subunit A
MLESYVPILILFGITAVNAVGMVVASQLLSTRRPTPAKSAPYESGMLPIGGTRERFSVKFYMVAILFIVFDLEVVFLIPWAVAMRELGWGGFLAASIFLVVLTLGLVYEWKKGAMQWD